MEPSPNEPTPHDQAPVPAKAPLPAESPYPLPAPKAWPHEETVTEQGYDPHRVYGINRRFSLATVMVMMAGASLILAGLNPILSSLAVPAAAPVVGGTIVLLCIATALGQMFLFRGRDPRNASFVVGAVFCALVPLVIWAGGMVAQAPNRLKLGWAIILMFWGAIFGPLPGYLAGCLVAGVLLVMDLTESIFARWRKAREPDDDDPWPAPKTPGGIKESTRQAENAERSENAQTQV
jgi:4-amino-4-deoxy-L-arabinose transferase-like glycosyltransferase